jgi:hypothetical protein
LGPRSKLPARSMLPAARNARRACCVDRLAWASPSLTIVARAASAGRQYGIRAAVASASNSKAREHVMDVNSGMEWSAMDIADLENCLRTGTPLPEIASFLMRDEEEVRQKIEELRLVGGTNSEAPSC